MASKLDSALGGYLKAIKQYDLLTPEQEQSLGRRIQAANTTGEQLEQGEINVAELERVQNDAAEARNAMVHANLRLVISVAKNFRNRGLPMEDLIEEGNVGLMNAVDRFDPTVGSRFSTYASYWIDQAIRRAVQAANQMIHIPSYLMEQIGHMRLALRSMSESLGRPPSIEELALHMEISPRKATAISQAIRACTCPTQSTPSEDGSCVTDTIPDTRTPQPYDAVFTKSDADFVEKMLTQITDREAHVLKMRYGLSDGKRMTLKEIGETIGLTRERVRQIEKEARRKLEENVKDYV